MKMRTWMIIACLTLGILLNTTSTLSAQVYTYGYNYGYAYTPAPFAYYPAWGYNPYAFSNAYNPMTTSWPSMMLYNNFYNRYPRAGFGSSSNYYNPYTGGYLNQYRYGYIR
jgi:hypothetical protein